MVQGGRSVARQIVVHVCVGWNLTPHLSNYPTSRPTAPTASGSCRSADSRRDPQLAARRAHQAAALRARGRHARRRLHGISSRLVKSRTVSLCGLRLLVSSTYAQGIGSASRAILSEVFHKDAIIYGNAWGSLMGGHIEKLYQDIERYGPSPNMTYHVDVLSVTPTTAVLRVHLDNLVTSVGYEDNLSLIKDGSKWTIVCKIFQEFKSAA